MGSVAGAVIGGYLLAMIELLALISLGSSARGGIAFAALFLMLILRPQGLFGTRLRDRI
jgi:branched-chain amino acid transport system permease protein